MAKSKIIDVGRNVIPGMNYPDVFQFKVGRMRRCRQASLWKVLPNDLDDACPTQLLRQINLGQVLEAVLEERVQLTLFIIFQEYV